MTKRNPLDDMPTVAEMEASRVYRHRVIVGREVTSCAGAMEAEKRCTSLGIVAEHVRGKLEWQLEVSDDFGSSTVAIQFCPWCGERLAERAEWPDASTS